jgi:hypothetical protein
MDSIPAGLREALAARYELERVVGRGGMATVYLARDVRHGRPVAVKVLRPDLAEAIGSDRFLHEIEIAAGLNHPHILTLIDSGEAGGFLYFVMPYVEGGSLRGFLTRRGPMALSDTLPLVWEIAGALGHAHRRGVVHRDVKPENVLLSEGHAIVTDFGIAKAVITAGGEQLTRSGFPLGTPGYMSPEQAAGRTDLDATTDVYGLACVVYEMLIGETPGMWLDAESVRLGRFTDASPEHRVRLDELPGRLEQVLAKALAMRTEQRFVSPEEFVSALEKSRSAGPRFSDAKARQLIERAAEIEAGSVTTEGDYALSIGGVQRIGAEAGIPPEYFAAAAREIAPEDTEPPRGGVLGLRPQLEFERRIAANDPSGAYPQILAELRATLGEMGQLEATLDDGFAWSSRPEGAGRKAHVLVQPGDVDTQIRITDRENSPTAVALVPVGAVSAVLLGAVGAIVHQETGSDLVAAVIGGSVSLTTLGAGYWAVRTAFQRQVRRRHTQLRGLLDRLEAIVLERGTRRRDAMLEESGAHREASAET